MIAIHPAWPMAVLISLATIAIGLTLYRYRGQHSADSAPIRRLLALRVSLILVVILALLAPVYSSTTQLRSRGTLWLLIDDSGSMRQVDRQAPAAELQHWSESLRLPLKTIGAMTRGEIATAALTSLHDDLEKYDLKIVPISDPRVIAPAKGGAIATIAKLFREACGRSTALGDALRLVRAGPKDDATVLLVSDGRQNAGSDPLDQTRRLAGQHAPVFTLAVGSRQPVRDAAVDSIDAPDRVFSGDEVVLSASIRMDGIEPAERATVELLRDGRVLQQKIVSGMQPRSTVEFTDKPDRDGTYQYEIEIQPLPNEATTANNRQTARVLVSHERLKVLLVDDEPRWEFRFLRNYLNRDRRFEVESVLLSPARVENIPPTAQLVLPTTRQQWSKFDLAILGDVPPERLSAGQQSDLTTLLRQGNIKALVLIAGPRNMPARFAGAPLAEAIPVELSGFQPDGDPRQGFVARPTASSALSRFSIDMDANDALWANVPIWFWHAGQTVARPGATVAWTIDDSNPSPNVQTTPAQPKHALLAKMHYGSGRVMYLASPETWRLRYVQLPDGTARDLHRQFWGQAIRWASAGPGLDQDVATAAPEDRNVNADPQRLAAIAKASGGLAFDSDNFPSLASSLPRSDHVRNVESRIGFFTDDGNWRTQAVHWILFAAFIALITVESILRKRRGLP
jgi:hypothetical protein